MNIHAVAAPAANQRIGAAVGVAARREGCNEWLLPSTNYTAAGTLAGRSRFPSFLPTGKEAGTTG